MRWTTTITTLLLAAVLATPALAQDESEEMKKHGEMMKMQGMHGMADMLESHAEQLNLTDQQLERFEALDARMEAERERHHQAMESIHEDAMGVLTAEQRERVQEMMRSMHAERGEGHMMKRDAEGHKKTEARGEKKMEKHGHDDPEDDEDR